MLIQRRSEEMRELLLEDPDILTSAITPIEIVSTLWRQRHGSRLPLEAHLRADSAFAELSGRWAEAAFSRELADTALHLVSRHLLRSLDAIQLASAFQLADLPQNLPFVSLDEDLKRAARAEGFPVLP
jgi:predicted nucleic acid-binding protein